METIRRLLGDPSVISLILYVVTLFGTILTYIFGMQKGFHGSVDFLKRVFPNRSEAFYVRWDFAIVSILGSVAGLIIFAPKNALQALAAGCGWVGAVNALLPGRSTPPTGVKP